MKISESRIPWRTFCLLTLMLAPAAAREPLEFKVEKNLVYSEVQGKRLKLDVYVPSTPNRVRPAVLVVHGGAWRSGSKEQLAGYARNLAERGFVAFAINYRLAPVSKFPAQIEDCRSAVKWIRKNAGRFQVDPLRLGAIGYSAGGHLAALLGTTGTGPSKENGNTDMRIQAVVAGGAPVDFAFVPKGSDMLAFWLGGTRDKLPEIYKKASPTSFVSGDSPPMFFFNGTKDKLVPPMLTLPLHLALKTAGVESEFHKLEGASHLTAAINEDVLDKAWLFFEKHLKASEPQVRKQSSGPSRN